jgi:nitroreductase
MKGLEAFQELVQKRRAVRHFKSDSIEDDLLLKLLDCARWAPSGYNLQPTHYVVVTDAGLKKEMLKPCMGQSQVLEAPAVVVFAGDHNVVENQFSAILEHEIAEGMIDQNFREIQEKYVSLAFSRGWMGLGRLAKWAYSKVMPYFIPVPSIPAIDMRNWLIKQVMLSAMNFMLAAESAGLATVPMEGFDGQRIQKILGLPQTLEVALVVPVGYEDGETRGRYRLPLEHFIHWNRW